jgi:hypothetical protein
MHEPVVPNAAKEQNASFYDKVVSYRPHSSDASRNFFSPVDVALGIDKTAQLYRTPERFNTDLEYFQETVGCKLGLNLGRNDRIVDKFTCAFTHGRSRAGRAADNKGNQNQTPD